MSISDKMAKLLLISLVILGMVCHSIKAQEQVDGQLEPQEDDEFILGDEGEKLEREFDESVLTVEGRPDLEGDDVPDAGQVKSLYAEQRDRIVSESKDVERARAERVSVSPYYAYFTAATWNVVLNCCPRTQNWGCRSVKRRLPCFAYWYYGVREWCCPFWPQTHVSYCNCRRCAILTSTCASIGQCYRRYRLTTTYAVCYRNYYWGVIRRFRRFLPSSCYCRAQCP